MIVHIGTTIQAVFGKLDPDGNVVEQQPISVRVDKLQPELFTTALEALLKAKAGQPQPAAPADEVK